MATLGKGYLCFMRVPIAMFSTRVFWIVVWFITLVGIVLVVFFVF